MKILHIATRLTTGGLETMLVDIINEQVKIHSVSLIIINKYIEKSIYQKISSKINVLKVNRKLKSKSLIKFIKFNFFILKENPDIIHCHGSEIIKYILFKNRYKIYHTVHSTDVEKGSIPKYNKIFAISKAVQLDLKNRLGIDSVIVYNGIRIDDITPKINYQYDIFKIVCVSRLNHLIKGQDVLIKAINILINERNTKNIHLDFIGEGESLNYIQELATNYHIEKNISFLGLKSRTYVYKNLREYELLVQPSNYEGFGLTVVEAMAAKVPVLVSNIGGPMEIIEDGEYGFYFKVGDLRDLAKKIELIMVNYNTVEMNKKIDKAFYHVTNNFDIKLTASNYLRYY